MRVNPVTNDYVKHHGIDIGAEIGTDTFAIADGVITEVGEDLTYGLFIKYKIDEDMEVIYAHLDEVLVSVDEKVSKDMVIGKVGNTGNSTGSHLHYGIYVDNISIDPIDFVTLDYTQGVVKEYTERGELFTYANNN